MRWDRRSLSGISQPNPKRAGSMAIRPGPNRVGPALSSRSHAASLRIALMALVRRQSKLLAHGRPAMATVTKVEKKRTEKGTSWRVHYEWTTMSGATRSGKYNHGRKNCAGCRRADSHRVRPRQHVPAQQVPDAVRSRRGQLTIFVFRFSFFVISPVPPLFLPQSSLRPHP